MIIANTSGFEIAIRWNQYICTYVADVIIDAKCYSYPLREGDQYFKGVNSITTVPDSCNRYPCDMKDSEIIFS